MANVLSWLTGREDRTQDPWPFQPQAELRAYNPTQTERVGGWIQDLLMAGGAQPYSAGHIAHGVRDLLSMSPLGIGMSAADLLHAKNAGDPMGAAAAAIGMVPGLKPEVQAVRQGIRAFHGSPHDFDKFDIKKIGTGEGAQAYGHGLYFAENEAVARDYKKNLAPNYVLAQQYLRDYGEPKAALEAFDAMHGKGWQPEVRKQIERAGERGHLYEVNINAKPEQFLDWDRSLRDQPNIAQAFQDISPKPNWFQRQMEGLPVIRHERATNPESTGGDAYGALSRMTGEKGRATDMLREAGVPGIRYLDQGSRSGPGGMTSAGMSLREPSKTSNYVLFNDQLVDIMRKYGLAAPAAAGAASYAMQPQEAQAGKAQAAQFQQPAPLSDRINQMIDNLQWGGQWQGRMRLPLQQKVNNMLGESVWPPLR